MKKFLFTLAALLMAGSAFAENGQNYLYLDQLNITADQVGTNITVPVKMHNDNAVSAGTINFTFPEGLVLRKIDKGTSISSLVYHDDWGDEWTADNTIFTPAVATTNFAFATVDKDWHEIDGVMTDCGAVKFLPGDYDQMAVLTIRVTAVPEDAKILVTSQLSCGNDPRPEINRLEGVVEPTIEVSVNPAEAPQPTAFEAEAEVVFNENVASLTYVANDPNATVVVTVDGVETDVEWNNGEATYTVEKSTELGNHTVTVAMTVSPDGVNYVGEPVSASDTYSYTVTKNFDADVEVVFNGNVASLTYVANDEDAVPTVYVNGVETAVEWNDGEATYTVTESTIPGTYNVTVELSVAPGNQFIIGGPVSDSDTYTYTVQAKTEKPVITPVDKNAHHFNFTVQGEGTVLVYVDGVLVQPVNGVYTVYAVEGQPVDYVITATAQGENMLISDEASLAVHFDAWDGVDELVNGKTVAGVRYFNMAGQEMQEANGMTIVVTTYTDGTTSAVKVMK